MKFREFLNKPKKTKPAGSKSEVKKKMWAVIPMLLLSLIMLVSVTFAWLVLSTNPEVSGVKTVIGANGSLEIALFNTETRNDYSKITSNIGDSADKIGSVASNITWGNIVDLSDDSYGMNKVTLYPARLNLTEDVTTGKYKVDNGILSIPAYGKDGRVTEISDEVLASAVYANNAFSYNSASQTYGVRAVGATGASNEEKMLVAARSAISSDKAAMGSSAESSVKRAAAVAGSVVAKHALDKNALFNDDDIADLKTAATEVQNCVSYADDALRYGLVAKLTTVDLKNIPIQLPGGAEVSLKNISEYILNKNNSLTDLKNKFNGYLPDNFDTYITKLDALATKATDAVSKISGLTGGTYSYDTVKDALSCLVDQDNSFIAGKKISEVTADDAQAILDNCVIDIGGSIYNDIADFIGDYSTTTEITAVATVKAAVNVGTVLDNDTSTAPYLEELGTIVNGYKAKGSTGGEQPISDIYGYMLDLAFRCNASISDLQLQTAAKQRVYDDEDTSLATMGSGSNMTFSMGDLSSVFTEEEALKLIDSIRVAFVGEGNELLGVGKLDIVDTTEKYGDIVCDLYLYEYTVKQDANNDNYVALGKRLPDESKIISLTRNKVAPVSVLVWLDGEAIDNTMVAPEGISFSGFLNLQFSSSAELSPMTNTDLKNEIVDKTGLQSLVNTLKDTTVKNGQKNYTNKSWNEFTRRYVYAANVLGDQNATPNSITRAGSLLKSAVSGLTEASPEELRKLVEEEANVIYESRNKNDKGYPIYTEASYSAFETYYQNNIKFIYEKAQDESSEPAKLLPTPSYSRTYTEKINNESKTLTEYTKIADLFANSEVKASENSLNAAIAEVQAEIDKLEPASTYESYTDRKIADRKNAGSIKTYYKSTDGSWYTDPDGEVISDGKILYDIKYKGGSTKDLYVRFNGDIYRTPSKSDSQYTRTVVSSDTVSNGEHYVTYKLETVNGNFAIDFDGLLSTPLNANDSIDFKDLKWTSSNSEVVKIVETEKFLTDSGKVLKNSRGEELSELGERLFVIGTNAGTTVMTVTGYTEKGVYFELSFEFTLYNKADGAEINKDADKKTEIDEGESAEYTVVLTGNNQTEEILSVDWAFSQKLAAYTRTEGNKFIITNRNTETTDAVGQITVTVNTVQGNTYTITQNVTLKHQTTQP